MKNICLVFAVFCISALYGCNSLSSDDAENMVDFGKLVYSVEEVQNNMKDSTEDNSISQDEIRVKYEYKPENIQIINMNETYISVMSEVTIKEARLSTYRDYIYELGIDDSLADGVMKELLKIPFMFDENGYLLDENSRIAWVRVHFKYTGERESEPNINSCILYQEDGFLYESGFLNRFDRESVLMGNSPSGTAHHILFKPGDEYDVWMMFNMNYNPDRIYYMTGEFGGIGFYNGYSGSLIKMEFTEVE